MKRALSLVLAIVLAFGMASAAFATSDWDTNTTVSKSHPIDLIGTTNTYTGSVTVDITDLTSGTPVLAAGDIPDVDASSVAATVGITTAPTITNGGPQTLPAGATSFDVNFSFTGAAYTELQTLALTNATYAFTVDVDDESGNTLQVTVTGAVDDTTPVTILGDTGKSATHNAGALVGGTSGSGSVTFGSPAATYNTVNLLTTTGVTVTNPAGNIELTAATVSGNTLTFSYDVQNPSNNVAAANVTFTFSDGTDNVTLVIAHTGITRSVAIPAGVRIDGINDGTNGYAWDTWYDDMNLSNHTTKNLDETRADDQIRLPLYADMFTWTINGTSGQKASSDWAHQSVSESMLSRGNIDVRTRVSKGSSAIRDTTIQSSNSKAYVRVRFVEYWVNTGSQDYDVTVYLTHKNSRSSDTETTLAGTIENDQQEVYEGDDYISGEDGINIKAEDYVRSCDVYGGSGVTATKSLFSGQKYYFVVTTEIDNTDSALMDQYPSIDLVYRVRAVNMSGSGNFVKFDVGSGLYVYNADGEYIGMSNETLPYSTKYYLSTERIAISGAGGDVVEQPGEETSEPSDSTGGTTTNQNDNPGTGVNGFVNVAILAGVVALAGAGAVSLKK